MNAVFKGPEEQVPRIWSNVHRFPVEVQLLEGRAVRVGRVRVDMGMKSSSLLMMRLRSYAEDWEKLPEVPEKLIDGKVYGTLYLAMKELFEVM